MIPDEARLPNSAQICVVRRAEHPAQSFKRGTRILIASDLNVENRHLTMNLRRYNFVVPKDWFTADNSYKPDGYTDELPGRIEVSYGPPEKDDTIILLYYRGRAASGDEARQFHQVIRDHKDTSKTESLTKQEIINVTSLLGDLAGDNQYAAEMAYGGTAPKFNMTSAEVVSINPTTTAMAVTGEWRSEPNKKAEPEQYWYRIYLDGTGDGYNVHEISYSAKSKELFDKHKPVFDQLLKSLTWTPTR